MLNEETTISGDNAEGTSSLFVQVAGEPSTTESATSASAGENDLEMVNVPIGEVEKTLKPKVEHRILIIHDDDQDGYCAANIIRQYKKQPTVAVGLYPYRHGRSLRSIIIDVDKWDEIFVVDLATPLTWIRDLLVNGFKVTVVDHHKSTIEAVSDFSDDNFCAYVGDAYSAAGLAWRYCHGEDSEFPWSVKMINDWDMWNHEDPQVIPFHYGMGCVDMDNTRVWTAILKSEPSVCTQIMQMGSLVGSYWVNKMNELTSENSYVIEHDGLKFLCCNGHFRSSYDFAATFNTEDHDAIMWYYNDVKNNAWKVSFRTSKEGINILPIAEQYHGAGHTQSCGCFMSDEDLQGWLPSKPQKNAENTNNISLENSNG